MHMRRQGVRFLSGCMKKIIVDFQQNRLDKTKNMRYNLIVLNRIAYTDRRKIYDNL